MATLKKEWKVFIKEMNKHGDKIAAYLHAFPNANSRKSADTSAERLLKKVEINKLLKINPDIQQKAQQKAVEELKMELKAEVLSAIEKRALLKQIAMGDLLTEEHFVKRDGSVGKYMRRPSPFERAKAMEIDNRMAGDDAPTKSDVTVKGELSAVYKKALSIKEKYAEKK